MRSLFVIVAIIASAWVAATACAATVGEEMLQAAPEIIEHLKTHRVRTVGVLKFQSAVGDGKPTDDGEFNHFLANRLEAALILKMDIKQPILLVRQATATAAQTPGADHLTAAGRDKLFSAKYRPAWGDSQQTVSVDAFLTGVVRLQPDGSLKVELMTVRLKDGVHVLRVLRADSDVHTLRQTGRSYTTRGLFDDGRVEVGPEQVRLKDVAAQEQARQTPNAVLQDPAANHPANPATSPAILVQVDYDGVEQRVEFRDGDAWIVEPRERQTVTVTIRRPKHDQRFSGPLGVTLKVNGESTIERDRSSDFYCNKWILGPGATTIVKGYLKPDGRTSEPFAVLSREQSTAAEPRYGFDVGTISWSVYQSIPAEKTTLVAANEKNAPLAQGVLPSKEYNDLAGLKYAIARPASANRGLIVADQTNSVTTPTQTVAFHADPREILHGVLRYYRPRQ